SHVVLQLPEPIAGTGRMLQLSAIAPLTSGKPWRLPSMRPEGVSWQEGSATLSIPESLALERLTTEGCRQSRTTLLPAPAAGESIEIQYYRPGAAIEVVIGQPRERLKVSRAALVEIGANEITSRTTVQFSTTRAGRRHLEIDVNPGWTIDAVEYVNPSA